MFSAAAVKFQQEFLALETRKDPSHGFLWLSNRRMLEDRMGQTAVRTDRYDRLFEEGEPTYETMMYC